MRSSPVLSLIYDAKLEGLQRDQKKRKVHMRAGAEDRMRKQRVQMRQSGEDRKGQRKGANKIDW